MDADGCVSPDPDPPRPPHQLDAASLNRLCRPDDLDGGTGTFMLCLRHCKAWAASNRAAAQLPNVAASEAISWFWCTADAVKGTTSFDGRTDYYPGGGGGVGAPRSSIRGNATARCWLSTNVDDVEAGFVISRLVNRVHLGISHVAMTATVH